MSPATASAPRSRSVDIDLTEPSIDLGGARVVVVHDYCTQRGGGERVALSMLRAFPNAPLITACYEPEATYPEFRGHEVRTTWINRVPALRRDPRLALPVLAPTFSRIALDEADVVICSSAGWAHGIRSSAPTVVYCHNPARWLYQTNEYVAGSGPASAALRPLKSALMRWDKASANRADKYLANSSIVAERIRSAYGIQAEVLPPAVIVDASGPQQPIVGIRPGFWLTVSRARGYKNVRPVVDAMQQLGRDHRLVIVGQPLMLEGDAASDRVQQVGQISDAELRWLYANCRGVVSAAYEDFGLTPLEGNAFGAPAVVLRAGGFLDTLVEGVTGTFIDEPTAAGIAQALQAMPPLDPAAAIEHARTYSAVAFTRRMRRVVHDALNPRSTVESQVSSRFAQVGPRPGWSLQHSDE